MSIVHEMNLQARSPISERDPQALQSPGVDRIDSPFGRAADRDRGRPGTFTWSVPADRGFGGGLICSHSAQSESEYRRVPPAFYKLVTQKSLTALRTRSELELQHVKKNSHMLPPVRGNRTTAPTTWRIPFCRFNQRGGLQFGRVNLDGPSQLYDRQ